MNLLATHITPLPLFYFIVLTLLLLNFNRHLLFCTSIYAGDHSWRKRTSSMPTDLTLHL